MGLTQVSTDGVKNDAITKTKIPANQIEASELADNAVDTNAIADQAVALSKLPHGDGSSDGKFLRANNGADPTFETVTGTTINNNADNRVITGSGTANTLNGESVLTFDSSTDTLQIHQQNNSNHPALKVIHRGGSSSDIGFHYEAYDGSGDVVITNSGNVGIGLTNPLTKLHVQQDWVNNVGSIGVEGSSNALVGYGFRSNGTYKAALIYRDGTAGNYLDLGTYNGNYPILFRPNATEKVRIDNEGLKFNGDTAAANALDDYEEGDHTVGVFGSNGGSSVTVYASENKLSYNKIGNLVTLKGRIRMNAVSYSGALRISLPYTVAAQSNTNNAQMCAVATHGVDYDSTAGTGSHMGMFLEPLAGNSLAEFSIIRDNASWTQATNSYIHSGSYLAFVLIYKST